MQASKINPGTTYAVRFYRDDADKVGFVVRFRVGAVTTINHRTSARGSPHDYSSTVEGWVERADVPEGVTLKSNAKDPHNIERLWMRLDPDKVLGPYEQWVELHQRSEQEKVEKAAAHDAAERRALVVRELLYRMVGANEVPADARDWNQLFRHTSLQIDISQDGVAALYRALTKGEEDAA